MISNESAYVQALALILDPLAPVPTGHRTCHVRAQFVYCQPEFNPGLVIISEFSGAAQRFGVEDRINPYNIADVMCTCIIHLISE